ncbi:hypothetical protein SVIOM342S_06944 [Streptomyces violaceorubidus]
MTGTPDETPTNTLRAGRTAEHRKARSAVSAPARALVLAMAVPVASATLAGTSAFAADDSTRSRRASRSTTSPPTTRSW